ncbi:CvpA family protein [Bacillus carboniphilus]|uniref:CvpA family protein n=1 Tax=Bacillus carboniphilus TaxID=86663 RepID=A0ABP3G3K5_9BACI
MLDLIIFLLLIVGLIIGLKRGFILQAIHMVGFIVSFILAYVYYDNLAPKLKLWIPYPTFGDSETFTMLFESMNLDSAYYHAIAFAIIFFATKILLQIIGSMMDFVAHLPVVKQLNVWAGGALGFLEVYLMVFIVLYIAALLPIDFIQGPMSSSFMAKTIVTNTPIFSSSIQDLWFQYLDV